MIYETDVGDVGNGCADHDECGREYTPRARQDAAHEDGGPEASLGLPSRSPTLHTSSDPRHLRMRAYPACRCTTDSELARPPLPPSLDPTCIGGLLDHPTPRLIRLNIPHAPHISDRPMRESTALRGLKTCACNEARNRGDLLPCQLS